VRRSEQGYVLASITYVDEVFGVASRAQSKARAAPRAATVTVRALEEGGNLKRSPTVISTKAESVGGVALSPSPFDAAESALAWVGKDGGVGQVFVTRLGRAGDKLAQRMLTRNKGKGCSDVALAATRGGWIAAWIDDRAGQPAIYAAKVGKDLERVGDERRIADAKGEASELRLVALGSDMALAWSEAREEDGSSGIFTARLSADGSLRSEAARVLRASHMASSLQLAPMGAGVVLGWVQPVGASKSRTENARRAVALAAVDASLRQASEPNLVSLPADASSVALDCDLTADAGPGSSICHVVVSGAELDQLSVYGFPYRPAAPVAPGARLAAISGVSTEDTSPVLVGGRLFFAEDDLHGGGRVRMAKIAWR
jgi:hypothetical protein